MSEGTFSFRISKDFYDPAGCPLCSLNSLVGSFVPSFVSWIAMTRSPDWLTDCCWCSFSFLFFWIFRSWFQCNHQYKPPQNLGQTLAKELLMFSFKSSPDSSVQNLHHFWIIILTLHYSTVWLLDHWELKQCGPFVNTANLKSNAASCLVSQQLRDSPRFMLSCYYWSVESMGMFIKLAVFSLFWQTLVRVCKTKIYTYPIKSTPVLVSKGTTTSISHFGN